MKRTICIPNVNEGRSFEVPQRTVGDRIKLYKQMKDEPKELLENNEYRSTMEGAYLALFVLQHKYPEMVVDEILALSDEKLVELVRIVYDVDESKLPKDFRQPKADKK